MLYLYNCYRHCWVLQMGRIALLISEILAEQQTGGLGTKILYKQIRIVESHSRKPTCRRHHRISPCAGSQDAEHSPVISVTPLRTSRNSNIWNHPVSKPVTVKLRDLPLGG